MIRAYRLVSPYEYLALHKSTIGLPAEVSMMMMCMSEYCHIEPQKYGLAGYCKIFFMLRPFLHTPANKFGHIHLIMCNLGEREPLIKPYKHAKQISRPTICYCAIAAIYGLVYQVCAISFCEKDLSFTSPISVAIVVTCFYESASLQSQYYLDGQPGKWHLILHCIRPQSYNSGG